MFATLACTPFLNVGARIVMYGFVVLTLAEPAPFPGSALPVNRAWMARVEERYYNERPHVAPPVNAEMDIQPVSGPDWELYGGE